MVYRREFEYLWNQAIKYECLDESLKHIKSDKIDTVEFFKASMNKLSNVSEVDMFFRAGSEWHLNSNVVSLLSKLLETGIKLRVIVNEQSVVTETSSHMRQPLKKYYGYDKALIDWLELEEKYSHLVSVRVANVPLMRRYYNIKGKDGGFAKVSYYTYGNYNSDKDYQIVIDSTDKSYELYTEEFEYLWKNASHKVIKVKNQHDNLNFI